MAHKLHVGDVRSEPKEKEGPPPELYAGLGVSVADQGELQRRLRDWRKAAKKPSLPSKTLHYSSDYDHVTKWQVDQ